MWADATDDTKPTNQGEEQGEEQGEQQGGEMMREVVNPPTSADRKRESRRRRGDAITVIPSLHDL